jgi:hypothetical protein
MTQERRRGVENIYHATWKRASTDREAFLEEACGGDEELRRDVESLLAKDGMSNGLTQRRDLANSPKAVLSAPPAALEAQENQEDPLAYLPCSTIVEFSRGEVIYGYSQPSNGIYVVIDGKVKLCRNGHGGTRMVVDIYVPDEFFGESGLLGEPSTPEEAIAIEGTRLMTWSTAEVERVVNQRPPSASR